MGWIKNYLESCAKNKIDSAIKHAEWHAESELRTILRLTSKLEPIPDFLLNRIHANERMIVRLKNLRLKKFPEPEIIEPRYKRILK